MVIEKTKKQTLLHNDKKKKAQILTANSENNPWGQGHMCLACTRPEVQLQGWGERERGKREKEGE